MIKIKNLDSFLYLASNASVALMPLLLLPVLTEHLSQAEYGQLGIFLVVVGLLGALTGSGVSSAILSNYYKLEEDDVGSYIFSSVLFLIASSFFALLLLFISSPLLISMIDLDSRYLYYSALISTLNAINLVRLVLFQIKGRSKYYFLFQMCNATFTASLIYCFVAVLELGFDGRVEAQVVVLSCFALFSLITVIIEFRKNASIQYKYIIDLIKFCFPLMPHYISGFFLMGLDRIIIGRLIGNESAGVYTIAVQITQSIALIADAINKSYQPRLFKFLNVDDERNIVGCMLKMNFTIVFISTLLIALVFILFDYVIGEEFSDAKNYIIILFFSQIFHAMYLVKNNIILNRKKTYLSSIATTSTGAVSVVITYLFTLNFGVSGAAYAQIVTMMFLWLITWNFGRKILGLSWIPKLFRG